MSNSYNILSITLLLSVLNPIVAFGDHDFTIPASSGLLTQNYTVSLEGKGTKSIGAFHFDGNIGSIEVNGNILDSFIQKVIPWDSKGYVLYQGLAFNQSNWQIFWLYCNEKNNIASIYYEGMTGPQLSFESASGTCGYHQNTSTQAFTIPKIALSNVNSISGFEIDNSKVFLKSAGIGQLKNSPYRFIPFSLVDCSGCGDGGWYELHSLFYNSLNDYCFGIIYLLPNNKMTIQYSFCTKSFVGNVNLSQFDGQWIHQK